jgi:hypothetical protein
MAHARSDNARHDVTATDGLFVAGFHMPFPALGTIERSADGYRRVPVSYQLNL